LKIASMVEVKTHFSAYVKASEQGPIIVTRNGKPVAVLVAVSDEEELERPMMAHSPQLQAILNAARQRIQAGQGIPDEEFWAKADGREETTQRRSRRKKVP
jgi:prevent-host-death family protein